MQMLSISWICGINRIIYLESWTSVVFNIISSYGIIIYVFFEWINSISVILISMTSMLQIRDSLLLFLRICQLIKLVVEGSKTTKSIILTFEIFWEGFEEGLLGSWLGRYK